MKTNLLIILGPTASGKSDLAVKLAKRFNGEVISADSRQVYKGLNVGTGKITRLEMKGIRHHLLDVIDAKKQFTAEQFKKLADKAIRDIQKKGKLPIICGGTGFYIEVITDRLELPAAVIDLKLRKRLTGKTVSQLFNMLRKLAPKRAALLNDSDKKNPRRLVRAIEIAKVKPPQVEIKHSRLNLDRIINLLCHSRAGGNPV
ncbi:MAG: tRNA (adenosine(37)-N6)-dimethylallyltransferase MiaA [Candidatus Taylorbacteria bacterium]|nr:tRNA (adenosine(37)-N6)-dimethylallyltransferase MiaA [Candidatus Taylorbacteria bacterium]